MHAAAVVIAGQRPEGQVGQVFCNNRSGALESGGHAGHPPGAIYLVAHAPAAGVGDAGEDIVGIVGIGGGVYAALDGAFFLDQVTGGVIGICDQSAGVGHGGESALAVGSLTVCISHVLG